MTFYGKVKQFANHLLDFVHTGVAELQHLATVCANEVVVLSVAMRTLIFGLLAAKLVFDHQIAGHQQVQRVVHSGTAHLIVLVLHVDVEALYIKVIVARIDFFQYRKALGRLALPVIVQIACKDALYLFGALCYLGLWAIGHTMV